jgi:hypothetical protein
MSDPSIYTYIPFGPNRMTWAQFAAKYGAQRAPEWALTKRERDALARQAESVEPKTATARDRYGWRSLPSGSTYLGAPGHRQTEAAHAEK